MAATDGNDTADQLWYNVTTVDWNDDTTINGDFTEEELSNASKDNDFLWRIHLDENDGATRLLWELDIVVEYKHD